MCINVCWDYSIDIVSKLQLVHQVTFCFLFAICGVLCVKLGHSCLGEPEGIFEVKLTLEMFYYARATAYIVQTPTDVFVKVPKFWSHKGDSYSHLSDSCRILKPFELSGPDICWPCLLICLSLILLS